MQIEERGYDKPIFIFEDSPDYELRSQVDTKCKDMGIKCTLLCSDEDAMTMRTSFANSDKGVLFIPFEFCRGLDLKFKVDAHCVILDTLDKFKESDILQAMGRASRSQGQGEGTIYQIADPTAGIGGWDRIKGRNERQMNDGGLNLKKLFEYSKKATPIHNSILRRAFSEGAWQQDPTDFEKTHKSAIDTLKHLK